MGKLNSGIGYALWQVQHHMQRELERKLSGLRLTVAQASALGHLAADADLSSAELARLLRLTPQAVSMIIGRLEAAGYLTRAAPTSGRRQPLGITPAGHEAIAQAESLLQQTTNKVFGTLDAAERRTLQRLLDRTLHAIET